MSIKSRDKHTHQCQEDNSYYQQAKLNNAARSKLARSKARVVIQQAGEEGGKKEEEGDKIRETEKIVVRSRKKRYSSQFFKSGPHLFLQI